MPRLSLLVCILLVLSPNHPLWILLQLARNISSCLSLPSAVRVLIATLTLAARSPSGMRFVHRFRWLAGPHLGPKYYNTLVHQLTLERSREESTTVNTEDDMHGDIIEFGGLGSSYSTLYKLKPGGYSTVAALEIDRPYPCTLTPPTDLSCSLVPPPASSPSALLTPTTTVRSSARALLTPTTTSSLLHSPPLVSSAPGRSHACFHY